MAQLLVHYAVAGRPSWGQIDGPPPSSANDTVEVRPLTANPPTTRELIGLPPEQLKFGKAINLSAGALLSPVTTDARLVCQGLNYQEHAAEAQQATRRSNLIFAKASSRAAQRGADFAGRLLAVERAAEFLVGR
jgi:2-keto-4-pentenoate hydratase/2-oxohepta-3-ene-1,7-dioic acid hydratase in catechol pathway